MKVNFAEEIKKDEQDFDLGGDYFKFEVGPNRIRICSPMVGYESVFKDKVTGEEKTNVRFVTLVLDRKTNKIKTAFLPYTIKKAVAAYQEDPEYTFDEVPMPYDITVNADGEGLKRKYSLTPARQNSPLTPAELIMLTDAGDVYDIVQKLKEKQGEAPASKPAPLNDIESLAQTEPAARPPFLK